MRYLVGHDRKYMMSDNTTGIVTGGLRRSLSYYRILDCTEGHWGEIIETSSVGSVAPNDVLNDGNATEGSGGVGCSGVLAVGGLGQCKFQDQGSRSIGIAIISLLRHLTSTGLEYL
jgi:hypothetical protein